MRLLLNENIPIASVHKLQSLGYDLVAVGEKMPGATDQSILEFAYQTQRVVVTFDRDCGELIYYRDLPTPAGVIYLRFLPLTPEEPAEYLHRLFQRSDIELENRFTVADRNQIRQRPLK